MKSYEDLGFGPRMVKTTSLAGTRQYTNALEDNLKVESTPYLNRTAISKGTVQTNLGGLLELYDKTGGTKVMSYDPATGIVTILGSLVAEQVNSGTYTTIVIAGNSSLVGTLSGGVLAANTLGSPLITNGTMNNATFGTPAITGGSHNSAVFGTPTLQTPTIDGTLNFDVNTGSPTLGINGDFAIETHTGSAILVARVGGTTFYFTSAGTLA